MTAKEITLSNIRQMFSVKEETRGVTLYRPKNMVVVSWYLDSDDKKVRKEEREWLRKSITKYGADNLFVKNITIKREGRNVSFNYSHGDYNESRNRFDLNKIMEGGFRNISYMSIYKKPEKIGRFPVSKWKSDRDSQMEMISELVDFGGDYIIDDQFYDSSWDEPDGDTIMSFSNKGYDGDYELFHGESVCYGTGEADYVDGRISNYNYSAIDDFWNMDDEWLKDYLKEIDPDEKVTVYNRKGKDWYVSPTLFQEQVLVSYRDDDGNEEEEEFWYWYANNDTEDLQNKVVGILQSSKWDLEVKSRIRNLLGVGMYYSDDNYYYTDDMFNIKILSLEYDDDMWEAYQDIMDLVDSEGLGNVEQVVTDAYEKFLQHNIDENGKIFGKYDHLNMVKTYADLDGRRIVKTLPYSASQQEMYAIEYKGEEWHFELRELLSMAPRKLYRMAAEGLTKREIEKAERKPLFEMAKNVFVSVEDSISSGNCKSGTNQFCSTHGIDTSRVGGVRGDVILGYDYSNFTRRAVIKAIARHKELTRAGQ